MFSIKTTVFMLGALSASALIAGCSQGRTSSAPTPVNPLQTRITSDNTSIGIILPKSQSPFYNEIEGYAQLAGKDLNTKIYIVRAGTAEEYGKEVGNMAGRKVAAIIVQANDPNIGAIIRNEVERNSLKLLTIGTRLKAEAAIGSNVFKFLNVPFLGADERDHGIAAVQYAVEEAEKRQWALPSVNVVILPAGADPASIDRVAGMREALSGSGIPAANVRTGDSNEVSAGKKWIVLGANDPAVIAACTAISGKGVAAEDVIGIGVGGSGAVAALESGPKTYFASVYIGAKQYGYDGVKLVHDWLTGEKEEDTLPVNARGVLITRDNLAEQKTALKIGITLPAPLSATPATP